MEQVWSRYGAGMEQVWSRSELGLVRKMRIIRIKRKDNYYFSYEKKVYRGSGKSGTHSMRGRDFYQHSVPTGQAGKPVICFYHIISD